MTNPNRVINRNKRSKASETNTKANRLTDETSYEHLYQRSVEDPEAFWREQGQILDWITPYQRVKNTSFAPGNVSIRWYEDGSLNACANCIDRHLAKRADDTAIIWEGDDPSQSHRLSFKQLHQQVCQLANTLKANGVKKGDVVCIYLPMIVEAAVAMLACARIGAVHTVVFGGFSPEALAGRLLDANCKLVLTANEGLRGGKSVALKANVDKALELHPSINVERVIVFKRTDRKTPWSGSRDIWWHEAIKDHSFKCEPEPMNAEDPLFILYTSGSTGKPKGILHTTGGYLVYASLTFKRIFAYQEGEIYWCTADVGWITGHSYMIYGPLANGATTLLFEGTPNYPTESRLSEVIDKHKVNILYTAPTAVRALMAAGDKALGQTKRTSLRLLGSVGEPINPEAWLWYHDKIGNGQCPIVDTWWQTETGGVLISPLPSFAELKPGAAMKPFFGIVPALVDKQGQILTGKAFGNLVILDSWPGQMRGIYGDPERFEQTYFSAYPHKYFSSDGAKRDTDGDYWITGRVDDVINVSGHRIGTAEVESALVSHPQVVEAAVVAVPHDIKGQGIYAYVSLLTGTDISPDFYAELKRWVKEEISAIATPETIHWAQGLPKTRSGKIMRRILRKIAVDEFEALGDLSTLANPEVVEQLIKDKKTKA